MIQFTGKFIDAFWFLVHLYVVQCTTSTYYVSIRSDCTFFCNKNALK